MFNTPKLSRFVWGTLRLDLIRTLRLNSIRTESRLANRLPAWRIDNRGNDSCRFNRIDSNRQHFQPTLHSPPEVKIREITIHEPSSFLKRGHKLQSIRVDSIESTTFSTHRQSPDQLYFLSLARIDFRHVESTEGETIRVDAIPVCRIANTKDESTLVGYIGQPSWYTAKSINQLL